jgi:hypothetical protein
MPPILAVGLIVCDVEIFRKAATTWSKAFPRVVWFHSGIGLTGCRKVLAFRHLQKLYEGGKVYTLYFHTACGEKTPCTSILLVAERHPARPDWWWRKDTLNVHTAVGGKVPARPIPH